jgi:hypothetical protein
MSSIEPPSGPERAYLDAYRGSTAMPDAARERVWARLAGGPVGPVGGEAANDPGPWLGRPGLLIGASAAVVTAAIVLALQRERAPVEPPATNPVVVAEQRTPAGPPVERTKKIVSAAPTSAPAKVEPQLEPPPETPGAKRVAPRARAAKPVQEPSASQTSSLAAERRLIEQTHAALGRGEADAALALLRQHAREFEAGVFVEEREALLAIATCTAGQLDDGRAAAREFLASYPHAVLAARVRKSCTLGE